MLYYINRRGEVVLIPQPTTPSIAEIVRNAR